jgi:DNA-directed RNA polymerase specialized sigma24 family protein
VESCYTNPWILAMAGRTDSGARGLTAEALSRLLAGLHHDRERAGEAYEALRRTLVKFFDWRGATHPDECADETLDRLARKLDEGATIDDPARFARGIARLVLLERWRRPEARAVRSDDALVARMPAPAPHEPAETEPRSACFERCLNELPEDGRELILAYYTHAGRVRIDARRRLADVMRLSENALRSRAQRIRDRLERCTGRCVERLGSASGAATRNGGTDHDE